MPPPGRARGTFKRRPPPASRVASATEMLREDHVHAMRLERVVAACADALSAGADVPPADVERIVRVISEFFDSIHYSREEDSYFPCAGASGRFEDRVRRFLVEHEFGRNVAAQISRHLARWRDAGDGPAAREPVARFLRTYSVYLRDHVGKEDRFFDEAEGALDGAEEAEMAEYFRAAMATAPSIGRILSEISDLERSGWMRR